MVLALFEYALLLKMRYRSPGMVKKVKGKKEKKGMGNSKEEVPNLYAS